MKQFVVMYRVPVETMQKWKAETSPEKMREQGKELMEKMMAWTEKNKAAFLGEGLPLGKNKRVSADGAKDESNDLNYMSIVQAESVDDVVKMFADNPHIQTIPTSFVDIMEVPHMGM